jgi:four helix bundle protein
MDDMQQTTTGKLMADSTRRKPPTTHFVEKLEIWQEAVEVVKFVYKLTKSWPKDDIYGLTAQVRRAAVAISAHLAEGVSRGAPEEMSRFAQITLSFLHDLDSLLCLAVELKYASRAQVVRVRDPLTMLARRTSSFIKYQEGR